MTNKVAVEVTMFIGGEVVTTTHYYSAVWSDTAIHLFEVRKALEMGAESVATKVAR